MMIIFYMNFQKAVLSIDDFKNECLNKWIFIEYKKEFDYLFLEGQFS